MSRQGPSSGSSPKRPSPSPVRTPGPDLLAVVGPTASGKTDLAIELAERLNGELISADSRQLYRECDIGTNKPDLEALHGIACHVIDVVDPGEAFPVAAYQR